MKKMVSIIAAGMILCNIPAINATAKVVEPTVVKTENWTTSYYIDDDESALYPYIECQADIYSDGTVKCYFWNTHKWDGFATGTHTATIVNTAPYSDVSREYMFKNQLPYEYKENMNKYVYYPAADMQSYTTDFSAWEDVNLDYFPNEYEYAFNSNQSFWIYSTSSYETDTHKYYYYYTKDGEKGFSNVQSLKYHIFKGALSNMPVDKKGEIVFTPNKEVAKNYLFRVLGHNFVVTPDIMAGKVAENPQLSEQEKLIQSLEQENERLRSENKRLSTNSILRLDTDGNGVIDAKDATVILRIYAINSTGGDIQTLDELYNYER